jgi:hypothetical protein
MQNQQTSSFGGAREEISRDFPNAAVLGTSDLNNAPQRAGAA